MSVSAVLSPTDRKSVYVRTFYLQRKLSVAINTTLAYTNYIFTHFYSLLHCTCLNETNPTKPRSINGPSLHPHTYLVEKLRPRTLGTVSQNTAHKTHEEIFSDNILLLLLKVDAEAISIAKVEVVPENYTVAMILRKSSKNHDTATRKLVAAALIAGSWLQVRIPNGQCLCIVSKQTKSNVEY